MGVVGGSMCVICGVDCGSASNLLAHADSHADESASSSGRQVACPALDCEEVLLRKDVVDHIVTVHYGLRWECHICSARHTTSRDAARCEHLALLAIPDAGTGPRQVTPKQAPAHVIDTGSPNVSVNRPPQKGGRPMPSGDAARNVRRSKGGPELSMKQEDGM